MANNKKPPLSPGQVFEVKISDLNHRGEGVGKKDNFTLFVPLALPGETARVAVKNMRKNYADAELLSISEGSRARVEPPCPHFPTCGGCQLLHLSYDLQLAWKQDRVKETLKRIAGIEPAVKPVLGMDQPRYYRNKADIHLEYDEGEVKAGFFEPYSRRVVDIASCLVQHPANNNLLNAVREAVREYSKYDPEPPGNEKLPFSRVTIRSSFATGESLLALTSPGLKESENHSNPHGGLQKLAEMISCYADTPPAGIAFLPVGRKNSRQIILTGRNYLEEMIGPFTFRISPGSFFQVNTAQAEILFEQALALAGSPCTAFDIYCGTGNYALYLAERAEHVIGIDSDPSAIKDAKENARLNKAGNIEFIKGRAEERPDLLSQGGDPKTIFLNPPRKGCSPELLDAVSQAAPERVVYVSCNPATLARDLKILAQTGYRAGEIRPVDMFPHTGHVECVTLIERQ